MRCLLLYDITNDRIRTKIADACLDYGLDRVQYSVFAGDLSRNLQEELFLKATNLLGDEEGHVMLLPLCQKDWQARSVQGCEPTSRFLVG